MRLALLIPVTVPLPAQIEVVDGHIERVLCNGEDVTPLVVNWRELEQIAEEHGDESE